MYQKERERERELDQNAGNKSLKCWILICIAALLVYHRTIKTTPAITKGQPDREVLHSQLNPPNLSRLKYSINLI